MRNKALRVFLATLMAVVMVSPSAFAFAVEGATENDAVGAVVEPSDGSLTDEAEKDEAEKGAVTEGDAEPEDGVQGSEEANDSEGEEALISTLSLDEGNLVDGITFEEGSYVLRSIDDTNCVVDVCAGSKNAGTNATLWSFTDVDWQKYSLQTDDEGYLRIVNQRSGLPLGVQTTKPTYATNVCQVAVSKSNIYQWIPEDSGQGFYYFRLRGTDFYLDVQGGYAGEGTNLSLWTKVASNNRKGQGFKAELRGERTIDDGVYSIASLTDLNENIAIVDSLTSEGANAITMYNLNQDNHKMKVTYEGNGYYSIRAVHSDQALDVVASLQSPGTNVTQWTYYGNDNQLWRILENPDGSYSIQSKCNDLYLQIEGSKADDKGNVYVDTKTDGNNQRFKMYPAIDNGYYTIRSVDNRDYVADVVAASEDNGANVTLWIDTDSINQKFELVHSYRNYYKIISCNSEKALDVVAGGKKYGTNVTQWSSYETDNQLWGVEMGENGGVRLRAKCSGLLLDVQGGYAGAGANLWTWGDTSNNNGRGQEFYLEETVPYGSDARAAYEYIKNLSSDTNYIIALYQDAYTVYVFEGSAGNWKLVREMPCGLGLGKHAPDGRDSSPTFTGFFRLASGPANWDWGADGLDGPRDDDVPSWSVKWFSSLWGCQGFHSTINCLIDWDQVGKKVSHGCIRLFPDDAKFIYDLPANTKIASWGTIYD